MLILSGRLKPPFVHFASLLRRHRTKGQPAFNIMCAYIKKRGPAPTIPAAGSRLFAGLRLDCIFATCAAGTVRPPCWLDVSSFDCEAMRAACGGPVGRLTVGRRENLRRKKHG